MDKRAIGVFDSGVGGLTAVGKIKSLLPNEDVIYFGDTARVPYGSHDKATIIKFAKQDLRFMLSNDIKAILIACGTVTSTALSDLTEMTDIPIIGVVDSAVKEAVRQTNNGRILVLATKATIKSHAYLNAIKKIDSGLEVIECACPLFVPLVENGYIDDDNAVTKQVVNDYLSPFYSYNADTVILGCTHYPLIKNIISKFLPDAKLVLAGEEAVLELKGILNNKGIDNDLRNIGKYVYYASECIEEFSRVGELFLGENIEQYSHEIDISRY